MTERDSARPARARDGSRDGPVVSTTARRTVSGRLIASYLVVLGAFTVTLGWSLTALRESARDATIVREAYLPLVVSIGEALAGQNVMAVQLNHITSAKNPADIRQWIETARRLRPATLQRIRDDARALDPERDRGLGRVVDAEVDGLERALQADDDALSQLFATLASGDRTLAERYRDRAVASESDGAKRLRGLRQRVEDQMRLLTEAAEKRERRSILLLILLSVLTLSVGLATSIYARRVLSPLSRVTERARAVAGGDLTPHDTVESGDELGELAKTFEDMVAAIRKARAELVQAERLATIGKMAAHITHEVRNPLSSISLNLELLEEELGAAGPEARQLASAIRGEVERLSRVAEQYLAAAREPRLQLSRESPADLVRECHAFVRPELERAGVESRLELGDVPAIDLDEGQLRQALVNLVKNAREALAHGGTLLLSVDADADDVRIVVEDDGPGIPEARRANVFDPFFTTKQGGTGLGLTLTRAIVEAHGGTIRCEAPSAGGTRFVITLPRTSDAAEAAGSTQEPKHQGDGEEADEHQPERAEQERDHAAHAAGGSGLEHGLASRTGQRR